MNHLRDGTSRLRDPEQLLRAVIFVLAASLTAYTIVYAFSRPLSQTRHTNIFFGVGMALFYLTVARAYLAGESELPEGDEPVSRLRRALSRVDPYVCVALAVVAVATSAYIELNFVRLERNAYILGYTATDIYVGSVMIVLSVDGTRRAYGWMIASVAIGAIGYALLGPYFPGLLGHSGMSVEHVARYGGMNLEGGIFHLILQVGATWVAIFIMFAGIAKVYGALDYILDIGRQLGKKLETGIVQAAVISSMAMGSITGSAAANTATTGSFTIPMMQDQGLRDDFATAIESVASSGGQMMPPVMGVAAFIMADYLSGTSYLDVLQAGLLPAALFYFSVGVAVHLIVLRFGWTGDRSGTFDRSVLSQGIVYLPAFLVLVWTLVGLRLSPLRAGLYTIVTLVATMYLKAVAFDRVFGRPDAADTATTDGGSVEDGVTLPTGAWSTTKRTLDGFRQGAEDMAPLVTILASMGVIVAMVTQTGLATKISRQMVDLGGGVLLFVLVLAMITSILFGLGMPTPAAYVLVVTLVVPALTELAVPEIVAHFFVFYFAMLSAITPPVAVAVAVGARISGAGFVAASKQALRIGAAGFVIPFAFITNRGLILWSFPETLYALAVVLVGVLALTVATTGYDGQRTLSLPVRAAYVAFAALALYAPALGGVSAFAPALEPVFGDAVVTGLQIIGAAAALSGLALSNVRGRAGGAAATEGT